MDNYYVRAPSFSFSYLHMGSFESVAQKLYEVNIKNFSISLYVIFTFITFYFFTSFGFAVAYISVPGELSWSEIEIPTYQILTLTVSLLGMAIGIFGFITFSKGKIINTYGKVSENARDRTDILRKLFIVFTIVYVAYCGWYVYAMTESVQNEWSKHYGYGKMETMRYFILKSTMYCFMCACFAQRVNLLHNYVTEYSLNHLDKPKKKMSLEYQLERNNRNLSRRITETNEEHEEERVEFRAY